MRNTLRRLIGSHSSTRRSAASNKQTLEAETLESRILYSAAPVEAPAEREVQTEAPVEAAPVSAVSPPVATPAQFFELGAPIQVLEADPAVQAPPSPSPARAAAAPATTAASSCPAAATSTPPLATPP